MGSSVDTTAWELLVRFQRGATRQMDASLQQHFGRSLDDYDVLHRLRSVGEPIRMTDLAQRLLVANSSCNRIVGRLVDLGLIERSAGVDRREVRVALTTEGRRLHRRMAVRHTRDIRHHVTDRLTASEHDQLTVILQRLVDEPKPTP